MLESRITRRPARGKPMVLAAFSYRYDAHLVPGLLQNLAASVHGHVAWNDTGAEAALTPETERRQRILAEARRLGADWILAADPDERFEDRLAMRMPEMLEDEDTLWTFTLREMFTTDAYRTDGVWGTKQLMRLFPLRAAGALTVTLHGAWVEDAERHQLRSARVNLYHLRMASPVRRKLRRELYAAADPTRQFQLIGYDYLDDDRGMRLEPIPPGRGFTPPFVEDHGTWAPVPEAVGVIGPDPLEQRLQFVAQSVGRQGHAAAVHVLGDLAAASPQDEDLPVLAACHALAAGLDGRARDLAAALLAARPGDVLARLVLVRACLALEVPDEAASALQGLPDGALADQLRAGIGSADFTAPDARWRRWVTGPATCHEGPAVSASDLAVVVIGFRAQEALGEAVASILGQDQPAEVVVVNSGGGEVRAALAPWLDRIRLIEVAEPLYVGAARNIGIDASRARFVAFLAGDCLADPGWVAGRLARHRAGAWSVATPVLPQRGAGVVAEASNRLLYWARRPETPLGDVLPFGRSYARRLFDAAGYFPPGLRVAEDDRLNAQADRIAPVVWAREVVTRHRDPDRLRQLLAAQVRRGENRADHAPYRALAADPDRAARLSALMRRRLRSSLRALDGDRTLGRWRRWRLALVQGLANRADQRGVARALERLARARALAGEGAEVQALRQAGVLDSQDWSLALRLATALDAAGEPGAEREFRRGLALAPDKSDLVEGLVRHLRARGDGATALAEAERAALLSPQARGHWRIASLEAEREGRMDLALAYARLALALAPDRPAAHRRLARLHVAMGKPVLALLRDHSATRLEADAARRV